MKKVFKWIGIVIGSLFALVILFYIYVYYKTQSRINKEYRVSIQNLVIPADSAAYARGRLISINRGCQGCHGEDLGGGRAFADDKTPIGMLYAANITRGKGGIQFNDEDWIRVLRHGVNQQNKSVWFMPSQDIYQISNQDLGDLLCYVKKQPPVDRIVPAHSLKPLGRFLVFNGQLSLLPAEVIDHNAVFKDSVHFSMTPEYGGYLAATCQGCHGGKLKGAAAHGPNEPNIPDISSTGEPGKWKAEDLVTVFRKGITPTGRKLNDAMPWKYFSFSDDELKSIYLYLQSIK